MIPLNRFHYHLPPELIAQYPATPRSASRLLCLGKNKSSQRHLQFNELPQLLQPGDLLVFNNTRVIPARLLGHKATGGKVEILVERLLDQQRALAHIKASKAPKEGSKIILSDLVTAEVLRRHNDLFEVEFSGGDTISVLDILNTLGHIPLPPYLQRQDEVLDQERYQTVYAKHLGAVAAPTAGLHFDEKLLETLSAQGVETAFVTLHVGAGTFQPVRVENIEDHVMHSEYAEVSAAVCEKIRTAKNAGKRVIAVGTTTVRCLETAAKEEGLQPFEGETNIFIYPGYQFRCIDALITNFHLPQSTLLMLVCSFAGYDATMKAYQEAIANNYRFYSYGDAMWIG